MWKRTGTFRWAGPAALGLVVLTAAGCNSDTDDPEISEAVVSAISINPLELEVDWVLRTLPGPDELCGTADDTGFAFIDSIVSVSLRNDTRTPLSGSFVDDVIIDSVDVVIEPLNGAPRSSYPPDVIDRALNIVVNANGTTTFDVVAVQGADKAAFSPSFPSVFGRMTFTFEGTDIGGEDIVPVSASLNVDFADFADPPNTCTEPNV